MAAINVLSVIPGTGSSVEFTAPFSFTIEYDCLYSLQEDLEWKMIYVGSAESEMYDQVLDSVLVGPVHQGSYKFVFEGDAPDPTKIPADDLVGVTAVMLTCSYRGNEFIRIGYYINVEYTDEQLRENPPEVPVISALSRTIMIDHPRVTRFPVDFDSTAAELATAAPGTPVHSSQQNHTMQEDAQPQQQQQEDMQIGEAMTF